MAYYKVVNNGYGLVAGDMLFEFKPEKHGACQFKVYDELGGSIF
ncbi:hypothetical protein WME91_44940 [Sorangium sp. So ce269]